MNSIKLKTRVERLVSPNHGSSTGDIVEQVQYFNPVKCNWTPIKEDVILDILTSKHRKELKTRFERNKTKS